MASAHLLVLRPKEKTGPADRLWNHADVEEEGKQNRVLVFILAVPNGVLVGLPRAIILAISKTHTGTSGVALVMHAPR
jgi:hypothetical protein